MFPNMATRGAVGGYEQERNDGPRPPPVGSGDLACNTDLHIEAPEKVLDIANRSLDLDDEQHSAPEVVTEEVIAAAVAKFVEAHLRLNVPSHLAQARGQPFGQRGVTRIEQAIKGSTGPPHVDHQVGLERLDDASQSAKRHGVEPIALDGRNEAARNTCGRPKVLLAPVAPNAEKANLPADTTLHDRMLPEQRLSAS
jgi:hypothetical protein